ncbi:beta-lactamase family protein [Pseudoflavitalea sp. G-6-1-2]|uniref:serine hydrolase domain-containing protein n=1 Tax=Pseudoflavitalea sp. G-6-1-2 TaxID=2728841 RepID=UPI00146F308F|nr:serine hydrolase domain-containing protein [Pseudoflavitalea sp. G-6-1-2]NML21454.1 beta-lactamase family protein [Pseudoflavitalea sp. G-6-1-2]
MKKILLLLMIPVSAFSQKNYPALLDNFMRSEANVRNFNGNVLVARGGKVIYQKSFGYSNYEKKTPLNANSVFELASVSKQFTAMGILLLRDKGKLKLTDSLRQYFPELPYHNISIQQLLNHTSGLPDYQEAMTGKWDTTKVAFNKDMIQFLAKEQPPLYFAPGTKWEYSNTGYAILASIIEKVSGKSFKDFLQQQIFTPLGMTHSRIYNTRRSLKETIPNYALGYVLNEETGNYQLPDSIPSYSFVYWLDGIQGDGVVNSTVGDLLLWNRALMNHRLISEKSQKEMLSAQATIDTAGKKYYGYGQILGTNEIGEYFMHTGGWPGYHTVLFQYLKDDVTIIVLSNNESDAGMLAGPLAYILNGLPVVTPAKHQAIAADTSSYKNLAGWYSIPAYPTPAKVQLMQKEGKLFYKNQSGTRVIELIPESANSFYTNTPVDIQFRFDKQPGGDYKAYFIIYSMEKEMTKLPNP